MTTLIFESHATSTDNEKGIASGWLNPSLSEIGKEQAIELGKRYQNENIDIIYVSDLNRSYETAELAFSHRNIPIMKDSRLREWNYGKYNGASIHEVEKSKINHLETPFHEGESFKSVLERFHDFSRECLQEPKKGEIIIIGHRAIYYALECSFNKIPIKKLVTSQWKWQPGWIYEIN
jgi:broad specificity phosphatase PhoE